MFEVPKTWVAPLDVYSEHIVDPSSEEFKEVERNILEAIKHHNYMPRGIQKVVEVVLPVE